MEDEKAWVPDTEESEEFRESFLKAMSERPRTFDVSIQDDYYLLIKDNKGGAYLSNLNDSQLANLKVFLEEL